VLTTALIFSKGVHHYGHYMVIITEYKLVENPDKGIFRKECGAESLSML
jgi:hypothetical protein